MGLVALSLTSAPNLEIGIFRQWNFAGPNFRNARAFARRKFDASVRRGAYMGDGLVSREYIFPHFNSLYEKLYRINAFARPNINESFL